MAVTDPVENDSREQGKRPRIGVYVCHCGGNISDVVDVQRVAGAAADMEDVAVSRLNTFMCSDPGQEMIASDIRDGKVDRVVVAACSPSLHESTFRHLIERTGLNRYLLEQANIREQVSWVSKSDAEGATGKAIRLVAAAVAKSRLLRPLEPILSESHRQVVVIGGGVSGLRAARGLSRYGFPVTLLERSPFLGGRVAQLDRLYPDETSARDLLGRLMDEVVHDQNIVVQTQAEVTGLSGYVGNFTVKARLHPRGVAYTLSREEAEAAVRVCPVETASEHDCGLAKRKAIYTPYQGCVPELPAIDWETCTRCGECLKLADPGRIDLDGAPEDVEITAGAIMLATGFDPYQPRTGEFEYLQSPGVVTLPELVRMLDPAGPTGGRLNRNGRPVRRVCLIHCVGSRQVEGVHEPGPDGRLNTHCSRYCCTAALQAANQIRQRYPEVEVFDVHQDIRTYGRGHEDYYEDACRRGVLFFRHRPEEPPKVNARPETGEYPLSVTVNDLLTWGEEIEIPADLVVLVTGMVPHDISEIIGMLKLPRSADGFLQEVHPKLRPVEMAIPGVYLAGTCQAPMDVSESCAGAGSAAAKVSAILSKDFIELAPFVAAVDWERCRGSGTCIAECPHQNAISLVETVVNGESVKRAKVNAALCTGCGMCVPVCPEAAIQVEGSRLDQFEAMVDALVAD